MYRMAIPMRRMHEKREARETYARRPGFDGERAIEVYFTVLMIVILGMIVGFGAYAYSIIQTLKEPKSPQWQRSHYQRNHESPMDSALKSHSHDSNDH